MKKLLIILLLSSIMLFSCKQSAFPSSPSITGDVIMDTKIIPKKEPLNSNIQNSTKKIAHEKSSNKYNNNLKKSESKKSIEYPINKTTNKTKPIIIMLSPVSLVVKA